MIIKMSKKAFTKVSISFFLLFMFIFAFQFGYSKSKGSLIGDVISDDKLNITLLKNVADLDHNYLILEVCNLDKHKLMINSNNMEFWFVDENNKEIARLSDDSFISTKYKPKKNTEKMKDYEILRMENITYQVDVDDMGICKESYISNETKEVNYNEYECKVGSHKEDRWKYDYVNYEPKVKGKYIEPEECWKFKIITYKRPKIGLSAIDLRLNINGLEPDWAWQNSSFAKCRDITFDSNKVGSDLNNFPALVRLDNSTGNFTGVQADWDDVRFVNAGCNDGGSVMPYELEYATSSGANFWVNTSLLAASDVVYSIYYSYADAENGEDAENVWDDDYMMVNHMNLNGSLDLVDSTSFDSDCVDGGTVVSFDRVSNRGKVGFANDGWWDCGDPADGHLDTPEYITYEAWFNWTDTTQSYQMLLTKSASTTEGPELRMHGDDGDMEFMTKTSTPNKVQSGIFASTNTWYYVAGRYNATHMDFYINGVWNATTAYADGVGVTANSFMIANKTATADMDFNGEVDEVRVSNISRSRDWIQTTYYSESGQLWGLGTEETESAPPLDTIDLTLEHPTNTTYTNHTIDINGTTDVNGNITYSINGTANQTACLLCTSFSNYSWIPKGSHNIIVYALNATNSSDIDTSTIWFTIPNSAPDSPSTEQPSNGTNITASSIVLNITVTDPDGDSMDVSFFNKSGSDSSNLVLRFALSDSGHYDAYNNYDELTGYINNTNTAENFVNFTMFLGDNVDDAPELLPTVKLLMDNLNMTYYVLHGNHDQSNDTDWVTNFGYEFHYNFSLGDYAFVIGNFGTSDASGDECANGTWVQEMFDFYSDKTIFYFSHASAVGYEWLDCPDISGLIANHSNIVGSFSGHDHNRQECLPDNGTYYCFGGNFGGSGGPPEGVTYRLVEVFSNDTIRTTVIDGDNITNEINTTLLQAGTRYTLIGTDTNVANNSVATISFSDLISGTNYTWFANISDGTINTTSSNYEFGVLEVGGDSTSPLWQDIVESDSDSSTYSLTPNYGFQINCTDETGMYNVFFEHNVTGSLANITCSNDTVDIFYANITSMGVGVLNYSFVCNDTSGNQNRSDYNTFTVSQATPNIIIFNVTNGTYPIDEVIYWDSDDENGLTIVGQYNGTTFTNATDLELGAGLWNITVSTDGNTNYTSSSSIVWNSITKGESLINLYLNDTESNVYYLTETYANFTAMNNVSGNTLNFTINITEWGNKWKWYLDQTTPYENTTTEIICTNENNTIFNVTAWWDGNENYTSNSETHYAICYEASGSELSDQGGSGDMIVGDDGSGDSDVDSNISLGFSVFPELIVGCTGAFCDVTKLSINQINKVFEEEIVVCNDNIDVMDMMYPDWYWTCDGNDCIADFCYISDKYNRREEGINGGVCNSLFLNCMFSSYVKSGVYSGTINIHPRGDEDSSIPINVTVGLNVKLDIPKTNDTDDDFESALTLTGQVASITKIWTDTKDILTKPFWCMTPGCFDDNIFYTEFFKEPPIILGYEFQGLNLLMSIGIIFLGVLGVVLKMKIK